MCAAGNRVVFDDIDGSYIENKHTGTRTRLIKKNGTYHYEVWVKKGKKKDDKKNEVSKGGGRVDKQGDVIMSAEGKELADRICRISEGMDNLTGLVSKMASGFTGLGLCGL